MQLSFIDGHADTACRKYARFHTRLRDWQGHVTVDAMQKLERYAQFFAYCPVCYGWDDYEKLQEESYAMFQEDMAEFRDIMTPVGNCAQMLQAWESGKTAAFRSLEGAEGIGCDPGRLEQAHEMGFRMVSLMWNYENPLGGSNKTGGGLTVQGREFVRRAQQLHMIVDVSHASSEVFREICDMAESPVIASHSNCRAICEHTRNLTDDEILRLKDCGGTMGLNLYHEFLTSDPQPGFDHMGRHLENLLEVGGEDMLALGGDLDGISNSPRGFVHVDDYLSFTDYLKSCGWSETLLQKLCSENLMRVMDACDLRPV